MSEELKKAKEVLGEVVKSPNPKVREDKSRLALAYALIALCEEVARLNVVATRGKRP